MGAFTKLTYLHDMFQLHATAIVSALTLEEGDRLSVILDHTIIYPQGGGQPCDRASISSLDEETTFQVEDVRLKNGVVYHYGFFEPSESTFKPGQEVGLLVDPQRRELNSRFHTAGHLLDVCMQRVGLSSLKLGKGNHSPQGSWVEYVGSVAAEELEPTRAALQDEADRLVAAGAPVNAFVLPYEDAAGLCGGSLPDYISKNSSPRIVKIGDHPGGPCGGTHVHNIRSLQGFKITSVRVKKGITKVSYTLLDG